MSAIAVKGIGMVTGVGLSAPASCAALRAALDNFRRTGYRDGQGEWLMGSEVQFDRPWRGASKLAKMAAASVRETLAATPEVDPKATPLVLCLAEVDRPGRPIADDDQLLRDLQRDLGCAFHPHSAVVARGRVSVAIAIKHARRLLMEQGMAHVLVVATDTLLVGRALQHHESLGHLLTSRHSDGFIPGEAAASFVLYRAPKTPEPCLTCTGVGFGFENSHIDSEEPLRADGLTSAIKAALLDAGSDESILKFKIIDASGSQYQFKEASLAFSRLDRTKRRAFDICHPADCIGEVGAAIGPVMVGALLTALEKGYAPGECALMHMGNDAGHRAACVFSWRG